jgi:hypothetical protein
MEEQIPSSIPPQSNQPTPGQITPETLEMMKRQAREMAVAQYMAQQQQPVAPPPAPKPEVVYVPRTLTVAELILIFVLSMGMVVGIQAGWKFASETLPRIEIKMK